MPTRFRIKPVAPQEYVVQRKGLICWRTEVDDYYGVEFYKTFATKNEAKAYIDKALKRERAEAFQETRTKLHLSQPIEEYPA